MEQIVRPVQATPLISPAGATVSFDVEYTTDPANSGTSGLGLRLHWDSTQLTFDSLENVFEDDFLATGTPSDDTDDLDGDPNTDRLIIVSWVDFTGGTWPNDPSTLPVVLYTANFTTSPDFADATTLNFTASSTSPGFELVPTPVIIQEGEVLPPAIVTIAATDADAAEEGEDPGTFTITRTGDTTDALTVEYSLAGSAEAADYSPELTGTATIAAGETSVEITITPVEDEELEGPETVEQTIVDADDYDLGAETVATVTIADNDGVTGGTQIVTPVPDEQEAAANESVSIDVQYSTDPAFSETSGLGLRLHWDSSKLSFDGLDGVLPDDLIAAGDPQEDTEDFDDDADTDRFVLVSWADIQGSWPDDPSTLPVTLYTVNFVTSSVSETTDTTVNFSASSTSPDFDFESDSATITIMGDGGGEGPELTISITDAPDQVTENNPLTYTLTVTNEGDRAATDIVVEDALPFGFIPTDVDGGDFTVSQTGNVVTFSGGSLEAGESAVLTIEGMAPTTGPFPIAVNNTAVVDPDNTIAESDETNNLVIEDTTVTPAPNLIESLGTDGDDTLEGTPASDRLEGLAGDDLLVGRASADLLEGGEGADNIFGGPGNDILYGGAGDDTLNGGENSDTLNGGLGKNFLEGGIQSDVFALPSDAGTIDINQADVILAYQVGVDAIGLTEGLTFSDLLLEQTQITIEFGGQTFTADSTAIINTSSNDILGVVFEVTPDRIMDGSNFVPVQVGLF